MSIKSLKAGNRNFSGLAGQVPEHHVLLQEATVGAGGAASVTFSNIDQSYQHLQIRYIMRRTTTGVSDFRVIFNGVTSAGTYRQHYLLGDGSSVSSGQSTTDTNMLVWYSAGSDAGNNVFSAGIMDVLDYSATTKNKTLRSFNGLDMNGSGLLMFSSGLFINTSAVSSIALNASVGNWAQYTAFQLYGVK